MQETKEYKRLINVSEINSWLYCARKVYLQRICGLSVIPSRNMVIGRIKHNILESLAKQEEKLVSQIDNNYDNLDIVFMYENFIKRVATNIFIENTNQIKKFMIDEQDILKKVLRDFSEDIKLRVKTIKEALSKGFSKETLWKNLDSVYISELKLESEELGLKGRVDRIKLSRLDNSVIPYELKSREDMIFHSDEIQLAAYTMLLEYAYKQKITKGIVEVGNNKQEVIISDALKKEVLDIASQIRSMYDDTALPPPMQSNFNKCKNCEFREECTKL